MKSFMSPGMMVKTKATSITESELKMNLFCISNKRKSCWNAGTKPTRLHAYEQSISEIKPVDNKSFYAFFSSLTYWWVWEESAFLFKFLFKALRYDWREDTSNRFTRILKPLKNSNKLLSSHLINIADSTKLEMSKNLLSK